MTTYYSPLRYPGGKAILAKTISDIIIYNNLEGLSYYEPYSGGAGAALFLLLNGIVKKVHLNDADYNVYSFWTSILNSQPISRSFKTKR